jgi:predicted metalloprotease with PDZ domain
VRKAVEEAHADRSAAGWGDIAVKARDLLGRRRFVVAFCLVSAALLAAPAKATIQYTVSLAHPEQHLFHVTMQIPDVSGEVTVQMPAWNALYQVRDFSAHVRQVQAFIGSEAVPIEDLDKLTWRVHASGTITVRYDTYWDEPGPFATQLNAEHAFINPAMILMYVPERRSESATLLVDDVPGEWSVASTAAKLSEGKEPEHNFFVASSYDVMTDSPLEAGKFEKFEVSGLTPAITAVVHGDRWKKRNVEEMLRRVCAYELKLMGGAPYERYTFIFHTGKAATGAGGGMEHANSTAIYARSEDDLPNVSAHEFFHLWNVKRIRPATLEPVDYTKEQFTRALWFAEGVTSTYAAYTLVRTQLWSKEQFYFDLGAQITELESRPANRWQSAEQSSLDAWLEKYPMYNRPQNSVSYYTKGQVLGVLLDILIRDRTNNEKSLDDVFRLMNTEFAQKNRTYRDSLDVRLCAEKVAGGSFQDFFQRYVAKAEPFPYQTLLPLAGLELRAAERKRPVLGFYAERDSAGNLIVRELDPESAAAGAGLRIGDAISAWNGAEPPRNPDRWVYSQKPGSPLRLMVRRDDQELHLELRLDEATETFYRIAEDSHANDKAKRIREGILRGTTQPITALLAPNDPTKTRKTSGTLDANRRIRESFAH